VFAAITSICSRELPSFKAMSHSERSLWTITFALQVPAAFLHRSQFWHQHCLILIG
jgi:hypothetical protein